MNNVKNDYVKSTLPENHLVRIRSLFLHLLNSRVCLFGLGNLSIDPVVDQDYLFFAEGALLSICTQSNGHRESFNAMFGKSTLRK